MKSTLRFFLAGLITATFGATLPSAPAATQPPGATAAFISTDPIVVEARQLFEEGAFAKAENLLKNAKDDGDTRARAELVEVIRRTRLDYPMSREDFLAKVKLDIPDVKAKDITKWLKAGYVTGRTIDGQIRIFSSEPENLYIFCKAARTRKEKHNPKPEPDWLLTDHLNAVVKEADAMHKAEVFPVGHHVNFTVTVPGGTTAMKKGSLLRVWLPMPQEYRQQKDVKLISAEPAYKSLAPSAVDHGLVEGAAMRTIYFEKTVINPDEDQIFSINYEFTSYAFCPDLKDADVQPLPSDFPQEYLAERPPHILFTDEVQKLAHKIVGSETNPLIKARKIFHWTCANIPWHSEEEYSTIPSLCVKALKIHTGDCGVQSLTFQTLCRAAGVPTRWQSGWETKPSHNSMHDWCEIYIAPYGWLPCDPSYGVKKSSDPRVRDFYFGHQDSYRMIFNLDYGRQFFPPKDTFRSDPLDSQRGEVELDGKSLYFDQWKYKMNFTTTPGGIYPKISNHEPVKFSY